MSQYEAQNSGDYKTLEPVKYGKLTVHPIFESFGAEVEGVDFSIPIPDDVIDTMIKIQDKYAVTIYRDTKMGDDEHVSFTKQLAKGVELEKAPSITGVKSRFKYPYHFDAGNIDNDGNLVLKGTRRWEYNKGNGLWHTDGSFNQYRSKYSLLLAHVIPSQGGHTGYCDVRRAWKDYPEGPKKDEYRKMVIRHNLWHSRKVASPVAFAQSTEAERAIKPPAFHKLVQDAPNGEGETLFLAAHAELPQWRNPGDLVWWGQQAIMHRATTFEDQMEKRDMRRTNVFDDGPYANGIEVTP
ncbi:alpha-ketoglutarate-dependent 2,4-dichlorophenoxyacetate dioxygenase [Atractiella rhizophila]|nr:alpha-ketoglutarate-dependent 2,4-dichlorophenoxyacetate dioxygenase [Atractiella rhizophila]